MTAAFQRSAFQDNAFQTGESAAVSHPRGGGAHRAVTGGKGRRDKEELEKLERAILAAFEAVEGKPAAIEVVQASPAASVTEAQTVAFPDIRPEIAAVEQRVMEARLLLARLEHLAELEDDDEEVLLLS